MGLIAKYTCGACGTETEKLYVGSGEISAAHLVSCPRCRTLRTVDPAALAQIPGTKDLHTDLQVELPHISVTPRLADASRYGLKPGDIITEVYRKPVKTLKEFREALRRADLKKGVLLNFSNNGTGKSEILKESGD